MDFQINEDHIPSHEPLHGKLTEVLKSIPIEHVSNDYLSQMKAMLEFDRRFRSLETLFEQLYTRITMLEKEFACKKEL